mmetsp:Transcript_8632/g.12740  ORF Transcript_8632/g.12740 Transcript_8632/m.12740 type:complete len:392 (+) Transcript_8632:91-1266(+)
MDFLISEQLFTITPHHAARLLKVASVLGLTSLSTIREQSVPQIKETWKNMTKEVKEKIWKESIMMKFQKTSDHLHLSFINLGKKTMTQATVSTKVGAMFLVYSLKMATIKQYEAYCIRNDYKIPTFISEEGRSFIAFIKKFIYQEQNIETGYKNKYDRVSTEVEKRKTLHVTKRKLLGDEYKSLSIDIPSPAVENKMIENKPQKQNLKRIAPLTTYMTSDSVDVTPVETKTPESALSMISPIPSETTKEQYDIIFYHFHVFTTLTILCIFLSCSFTVDLKLIQFFYDHRAWMILYCQIHAMVAITNHNSALRKLMGKHFGKVNFLTLNPSKITTPTPTNDEAKNYKWATLIIFLFVSLIGFLSTHIMFFRINIIVLVLIPVFLNAFFHRRI